MIPVKHELAGRFKIDAIKPDGSRRVAADWFNNLILDAGLNRLGTAPAFGRCMVGSSSTPAVASQTGLVALVAETTNQFGGTATGVETGYAYMRITYRFTTGQVTGNLSEVGVGWAANTCFSRARILDGNGNPTTITVLSDEQLEVTYELRLYWPTGSSSGSITLGGQNYNYLMRASITGSWANLMAGFLSLSASSVVSGQAVSYTGSNNASLGDITTNPGGTQTGTPCDLGPNGSYVNNSYQMNYRMSASTTQMNTDISGIRLTTFMGYYKIGFEPQIPKDNTKTLSLDFLMTWARRAI